MLFKILLIAFAVSIAGETHGQKTFQPKATLFDWKGIIYRKEMAYEIRIHNNGGLVGVNIGKIKTYLKTNYYHLSIGYLKDPREKRQNKNFPSGLLESKSFVFGKRNSVINIRTGVGAKRFISEKARRKGIALGYDYMFGPSLAILKPNYLRLIYFAENGNPEDREIREEIYSEENAEKFTNYNDILGGTGYFKGFSEMAIVPGAHGKIGLFLSMGAFDEYVKALEIGLQGDIYFKKLPIMVETPEVSNKPYFFNFYIKFILGKRSN